MNEQIEAVRRMQKYIDSHLYETITPADLAAVSLFSPWYARRLFEQYTGMSTARYIRRLPSISGEPVCLWLPEHLRSPKENVYVQGAEVDIGYDGVVPEGFEVIELPASEYLMFQGEPFAEAGYGKAIQEIWDAQRKYDPSVIGYAWDSGSPRIQLEPIGSRGYIELAAVRKIT